MKKLIKYLPVDPDKLVTGDTVLRDGTIYSVVVDADNPGWLELHRGSRPKWVLPFRDCSDLLLECLVDDDMVEDRTKEAFPDAYVSIVTIARYSIVIVFPDVRPAIEEVRTKLKEAGVTAFNLRPVFPGSNDSYTFDVNPE